MMKKVRGSILIESMIFLRDLKFLMDKWASKSKKKN